MLRTYALAPDTVRRSLRHAFWNFQLIATLSFLVFGLYLAFLAGPIHWQIAGPIIGLIALAYFLLIFFNYRQQLHVLYSTRYEIDDNSITYRLGQQPPLHITRADITTAIERPDGLWVETHNPREALLIPTGLAREGDKDFYTTLGAWVTVQPALKPRSSQTYLWIFGIGGSFLVLILVNTLYLLVPIGLFFLSFSIYADHRLNRNLGVPPTFARIYRMVLSFLLFMILMKVCILLFGLLVKP